MKWKSKPEPKEGDKKTKHKFALFPVKVQDKWVWFEKYIAIYEYKKYPYVHDVVVSEGVFTEKYYTTVSEAIGWIIIDKKLIN
jgi:hypothetical protein